MLCLLQQLRSTPHKLRGFDTIGNDFHPTAGHHFTHLCGQRIRGSDDAVDMNSYRLEDPHEINRTFSSITLDENIVTEVKYNAYPALCSTLSKLDIECRQALHDDQHIQAIKDGPLFGAEHCGLNTGILQRQHRQQGTIAHTGNTHRQRCGFPTYS